MNEQSSKPNTALVEGQIIHISPVETYGKDGKKRLCVIETSGKYPQVIPVEFHAKFTDMLNGYHTEDVVMMRVNINGREWNERYFVTLKGYYISMLAGAHRGEENQDDTPPPPSAMPPKAQQEFPAYDDDDNQPPF